MSTPKLSLVSAILININIMLGAGIFINTVLLAQQGGSLGAAVYGIVGILLFPLILSVANLLKYHQGGTFYDFGAAVHPYIGFISSWSYFIAKMASCALGIHVCLSLLQQIIPSLRIIPILYFDIAIVLFFALLNSFKLSLGRSIQFGFIVLKLIPIFFAIFAGIFLFTGASFTSDTLLWSGIPVSIPLVLYAFSGFEASCSLSSCIENPEKNGPRAVLFSYIFVVTIVMLYQMIFFGNLGSLLGSLANYTEAYPALMTQLFPLNTNLQHKLVALMHIGIASSSLGASYGIMYSNGWNLFTLAHNNHTFFKPALTYLNKYATPITCIFIEAFFAILYLLISKGNQIPLQQVGALGSTIAYLCSAVSLLVIMINKSEKNLSIPLLGIASCLLLLSSFVWSVVTKGITLLLSLFILLLILGSYMFFHQKKTNES